MSESSFLAYKKNFFQMRSILSERQALFFAIEEAVMVFLIVFQIYRFLSIEVVNSQVLFFTKPIFPQSILLFLLSIIIFLVGYVIIAMRDERVWLIHKNFSRIVFGTAKLKIQFTTKRKTLFFFAELVYSLVFALSVFVYLDPDINILPVTTPKIVNYIGFTIMLGIGILLFSHTKDFRTLVYGSTPVQKRLHFGRHDLKRTTNKKTGSIRIAARNNYHKKRAK